MLVLELVVARCGGESSPPCLLTFFTERQLLGQQFVSMVDSIVPQRRSELLTLCSIVLLHIGQRAAFNPTPPPPPPPHTHTCVCVCVCNVHCLSC